MFQTNRLKVELLIKREQLDRQNLTRGGVLLKTGAQLIQQGQQFYICGYAADGSDVRPYR